MQPSPPSPNLVPSKSFEDRPLASQLLAFFRTRGRLIILLCQLVVLVSFISRFIMDEQLRSLNQKLNLQITTIQSLSTVETELLNVQAGLAVIKAAKQNSYEAPTILETFASKIPANVYLLNVAVGRQKIDFSSKTGRPVDFGSLISNLKSSSTFKSIVLKGAQFNHDKQEFTIDLTINL
jgi:Tfp pilus assembly protein PilN